jgi:hypothetical protein
VQILFKVHDRLFLQEMMARQSVLAAEGADEHDQYWELVWANLVIES